jgi:peptidylprolyl isomerase
MSVKENDWISVEYEGILDDGQIFDSSKGREPLKFKVGVGMVIPGFDNGVIGMKIGEEKKIKIPFEEGYGPKNTEIAKLPKELLAGISDLEEGKEIVVMSGIGPLAIEIKKIEESTIDAILNHPLAGKNLTFKVKLLEILSEEEGKKLEEEMMAHSCGGHCSSCESDCLEHEHSKDCEED